MCTRVHVSEGLGVVFARVAVGLCLFDLSLHACVCVSGRLITVLVCVCLSAVHLSACRVPTFCARVAVEMCQSHIWLPVCLCVAVRLLLPVCTCLVGVCLYLSGS